MAGFTLAQATTKLSGWMAADDALMTSQSYSLEGRALTRADGELIQSNIVFWNKQVQELTAGGMKVQAITPVVFP